MSKKFILDGTLLDGTSLAIQIRSNIYLKKGLLMHSSIHATAAKGFQSGSDAYERGRPEYPKEAVDALTHALGLNSDSFVVDLGAGTGKFTRQLLSTKARILAIEPVEAMRKKFASILPTIEVLSGSAESLPLQDHSVDSLVVAQAFHWFDGPSALAEIHRVLKKDGKLGLIWNARDATVDWFKQVIVAYEKYERGTPQYRHGTWKKAFQTTSLFTPLQEKNFPYIQTGNIETVVDHVLSISFIAALPAEERLEVAKHIRTLLQTHPVLQNKEEIEIPYRTDIFWCKKI